MFRVHVPLTAVLLAALVVPQANAGDVSLFAEDFESLAANLGPIVTFDSELRETEAWTPDGPAGWTEDDSGVPTVGNANTGVTEFEGWSFVDRDWWVATAGGQERENFISGVGVVAVADPDEWDDFGTPGPDSLGFFDAKLTTPAIDLTPAGSDDVNVFFNSSWRPEGQQKATLTANYNDSESTSVELLRYDSVGSIDDPDNPGETIPNPFFVDDAPNESVLIPLTGDLAIPSGATEVSLEFRLFDAVNNWWWAFDNLQVFTGDAPPSTGQLRAVIDRDTQEVKIVNDTGSDVTLRGYSLRSSAGVFDEAAADFLAPADGWLQATNVGDETNDLSEINLASDVLAAGEEIVLGDVWDQYFVDESDISFEYLVEGDDDPFPGLVEFVGNDGESYAFLDLNYDGAIDILDWLEFKAGFGKALTGFSTAQLYNSSDLDTDGQHTALDFQIFQREFDAANGAGAFAAALAVPEPASLGLVLAMGVGLVTLRRRVVAALLLFVACFGVTNDASAQLNLYFEDFESAVLGPFIEEGDAGQEVWTNTFAGWTTDNSGVPGVGIPDIPGVSEEDGDDPTTDRDSDGVTDWSNWAWVTKDAWISADDQGRSSFTRASGVVMVADNDEWDDADSLLRDPLAQDQTPDDLYDVFATTPVIPIPAGIPAGRITLSFDSSWRGNEFQDDLDGDNNESAEINVSYDGGDFQQVFKRESDPESDFFNPNLENERVSQVDLLYDGVATSLQLEFGQTDAWNDWWWALDNISVSVPSNPLKLRINTTTGEGFLDGDDSIATEINYLAIESNNGVLTGDVATGLSGAGLAPEDGFDPGSTAGDSPGEQWESLTDPETADSLIAEAFLFGDSLFDDTVSISLGRIFDPATGELDRDVRFSYALNTGDIVEVPLEDVEYFVGPGLAADFNGDGSVDLLDLDVLGTNFGLMNTATPSQGDANGDGNVDLLDLDILGSEFGLGSSVAVPEPTGVTLLAAVLAALGLTRRHRGRLAVPAVAVLGFAMIGAPAEAFTLDREYLFGEGTIAASSGQPAIAEGGVAGQVVGSGNAFDITFDTAGVQQSQQLIPLVPEGQLATPPAQPRYISTADRPDFVVSPPSGAPLGVVLNDAAGGNPVSTFNRQYLATGFRQALNFPERSISSTFEPGGTINYDLITDRGFQLWTKPLAFFGDEQHIVMDTNQHGVLINDEGKFAMRYAFDKNEILQQANDAGVDASEFADLFDYASDVTAEADTWYHLSVVRSFGPGNGSVLYVDGVAVAAALGEYLTEVVVNDDFGEPDLSQLDVSPLVVGANTGNPSASEGNPAFMTDAVGSNSYYSGVVDDLEMFVMGLNGGTDGIGGSGSFGEYVFEDDNGYAAAFKPTTAGDVDGDGNVDLADAAAFAGNWLFEKRLEWTDPNGNDQSLVVGDLESRGRGDFNYDGVVDLADWAILNNANPSAAFAAARAIAGGPIPEPTAALLAVIAAGAGVSLRGPRGRGA